MKKTNFDQNNSLIRLKDFDIDNQIEMNISIKNRFYHYYKFADLNEVKNDVEKIRKFQSRKKKKF